MDTLPESVYRAFVECSVDLVTLMKEDGTILYESPAIEPLLGYTKEELVHQNILKYLHPADLPRVVSLIAEGKLYRSKPYTARVRFKLKDGSWKWIESTARYLPEESNIDGILIHTRVVPDQVKIEAENTQAEVMLRKFQHIIEQSPSSIVLTDPQGVIEYVNPAFTQTTGYTLDEAKGKNPRILKSGVTDITVYADLWSVISQKKTWRGELCNKKKNGDMYWEFATISPVLNEAGEIVNFAAIKDNISDRKAIEARMVQSEEYLGNIINVAADPIFVKDRQHKYILLNDSMCSFMGRKRDELIGKSDYDFFPKEEADVFWAKDEEVFASESENTNEEFFTDASGVRHTIVTKKTIYTDKKGAKIIVGIIRDITEQKKIEQELQQHALETERMNALMVGRELKMIELKKEIESLKNVKKEDV